MLVVDSVELTMAHQLKQVWNLDGDRPIVGQCGCHSRDEIIDIRHVSEDVVRYDKVGFPVLRDIPGSEGLAEELAYGVDPDGPCRIRRARSGLDADTRNPARDQILEKISIVGCNFDDQAALIEPQA